MMSLGRLDRPDLGSARHNQHRDNTDEEFLRITERNVAAPWLPFLPRQRPCRSRRCDALRTSRRRAFSFPVADDVDAGRYLPRDDAAAFEAQSGGAVAEVDTPSLFLGQDQVEQRSRAGQAADTGSGNSLSAQFHGRLPHTLRPLKLMWPLERRGGVLPTVRQG